MNRQCIFYHFNLYAFNDIIFNIFHLDTDSESCIVNLSRQQLTKIDVPQDVKPSVLILDHNAVTRIENLENLHDLQQVWDDSYASCSLF